MRFHGLGPSRSASRGKRASGATRRLQALARATAKAFDAAGGRPKATSGRARTGRLVRRAGLTMLGHRRRRRSCHAGRSSAMKLHENFPDRLSADLSLRAGQGATGSRRCCSTLRPSRLIPLNKENQRASPLPDQARYTRCGAKIPSVGLWKVRATGRGCPICRSARSGSDAAWAPAFCPGHERPA